MIVFLSEFDWYFPGTPIDNKPALVQVMARRRTSDKPFPELTLTQFTDAYMRHEREMSWRKTTISVTEKYSDQHKLVITYLTKCGMKLLIHYQTSTDAALKFGIGYVTSSKIQEYM